MATHCRESVGCITLQCLDSKPPPLLKSCVALSKLLASLCLGLLVCTMHWTTDPTSSSREDLLRSYTAVHGGRRALVGAEDLPNVKGHRQRVRAEATRACRETTEAKIRNDSFTLSRVTRRCLHSNKRHRAAMPT